MSMHKTLPVIKVIKPEPAVAAAATTSEPPRQAGEHRSRNAKLNKENSGGGTKSSLQSKYQPMKQKNRRTLHQRNHTSLAFNNGPEGTSGKKGRNNTSIHKGNVKTSMEKSRKRT
jgi:hypothetical protein